MTGSGKGPAPAAFAIPGNLTTLTGGYIYERRLLEGLRDQGREVDHLQLPAGFPDPTDAETRESAAALEAVPPDRPLIVDGLVFGALDPAAMARVRAPICAMIHHPLGLESGLSPARAAELRRIETANLRLAAHVVVPSRHTAQILQGDFGVDGARISIAPPGFDRPELPRCPATPPLILSVGILHPRKGHDILLAALATLRDLDWRCDIVGADWDPGHAAKLRAMAGRLGLSDRVRFRGQIAQNALERAYAGATVFALATRYEGYGMVFSEALLRGLPVVACATGAVPDTVPRDAGRLVPPEDRAAFAQALRDVLTDGDLRMRMAGAAARAGGDLPRWADTATTMGDVLDRLAAAAALADGS